ncbi:imidazolonepropionase [Solitalea canadensis]|uniref:Imidazolonepropionase n=1 Tax=Solitalea canadensis (strain ATCC 29591 / DSM 3403 / JCM 21819 / LMG 8368 / NBRC 15130 / NCIMB 12057 / USAM 9D) TaxID=929556 RepID=H8KMP6_SOLCM|nr:imidazolonepropionase [Solitalea canadensis]AFD09037.1 imidazolonepropionase [Solitalea canadensis DSM 3403]
MIIINIKQLCGIQSPDKRLLQGKEMTDLPSIENAWLKVTDGKIADFGLMTELDPATFENADEVIDATGKLILPTWCDSHTHLVFAASREEEFLMKIQGKTYEEITAAGGGILNSARKLAHTPEEELYNSAAKRLNELIGLGTGAIEIKSGYGLSYDAELKMLRVIRKLKENFSIPVKATFLGAHAFPAEYKQDHKGYIDLLITKLLPQIADEGLADYIDAFCEQNYFSIEETEQIIDAGAKYGLKAKIHANQFTNTGAVQACVRKGALSVDHLEVTDDAVIESLKGSETIATLLPSCSLFINIPFANARGMIDAGLGVALASDFNPGTTPSGNMNLVVALACMRMKMLPAEAINAATLNGAYAMDLSSSYGSISKGKQANFMLTKEIPSVTFMPYSFGSNHIDTIFINGKKY